MPGRIRSYAFRENPPKMRQKFIYGKGFGEYQIKIMRPQKCRGSGHGDNGGLFFIRPANMVNNLDTTKSGHHHIRQNDINMELIKQRNALLTTYRNQHLKAKTGQCPMQHVGNGFLIINN